MVEHLSREQMVRYRDRTLPAAELIAVDAHLSLCAACRAELAPTGSEATFLAAIGAARNEHLSYEQMDAWFDNQLDLSERELVMAHIALCEPCARQLRAYESYAPAMSALIPPPAQELSTWRDRLRGFFRTPRFAMIVTVALVVLILSPLVIRQTGDSGSLSFFGPPRPASLSDLPANPDSTLLYPVSQAVEERQPILRWQSAGNEAVQVFIFDSEHKEVAHSAPLSAGDWLVPVPLDRGAVYSWEVRATAPGGAARQASFRVLSEADHEKLAAARAAGTPPAELGGMARQMGALSEAQRQFHIATQRDPQNADAQKNLDQINQLLGR